MSGSASDCDPALARHARLNVSVVIPTLDAAAVIDATLASLPLVSEIIVADGGSEDGTADTAIQRGVRVIVSAPGRGTQMSAGARSATCDWLLFLHADTCLSANAVTAISCFTSREENQARAAVFQFHLDVDCWQARLLQRVVDWRSRILALPYGDQGLLIHRDLYRQVGGYSNWPLMEDVDLVRRIGRRRLVQLPAFAITSAAKWKTQGWLRRSSRNTLCIILYYLGLSPRLIAKIYG